jgi:hypothetical protein
LSMSREVVNERSPYLSIGKALLDTFI